MREMMRRSGASRIRYERESTMPVSPDLRKRLLYTKYLLFRAKREQAERNDLGVAVSLLLMHDASELIMLAVADHLQQPEDRDRVDDARTLALVDDPACLYLQPLGKLCRLSTSW